MEPLTYAVFIGRFQPFHIGHMSIVQSCLQSYDRLIIIIGSSQESRTEYNPWTAEERAEIIRQSIGQELLARTDIVTLPDCPDDEEWAENLKKLIEKSIQVHKRETENGKLKTCIFTGNDWVREICERHGFETSWITYTLKVSGTAIREKLRENRDMSDMVCVPIKLPKMVKI